MSDHQSRREEKQPEQRKQESKQDVLMLIDAHHEKRFLEKIEAIRVRDGWVLWTFFRI